MFFYSNIKFPKSSNLKKSKDNYDMFEKVLCAYNSSATNNYLFDSLKYFNRF